MTTSDHYNHTPPPPSIVVVSTICLMPSFTHQHFLQDLEKDHQISISRYGFCPCTTTSSQAYLGKYSSQQNFGKTDPMLGRKRQFNTKVWGEWLKGEAAGHLRSSNSRKPLSTRRGTQREGGVSELRGWVVRQGLTMVEFPRGRSDQRKAGAIWKGCGTSFRGDGVTVRDSARNSLASPFFHFPFCYQCHPVAKSPWGSTDKGTSKIWSQSYRAGVSGDGRGKVQIIGTVSRSSSKQLSPSIKS